MFTVLHNCALRNLCRSKDGNPLSVLYYSGYYSPAFCMCPGYAGSFPAVPGGVAEVRL